MTQYLQNEKNQLRRACAYYRGNQVRYLSTPIIKHLTEINPKSTQFQQTIVNLLTYIHNSNKETSIKTFKKFKKLANERVERAVDNTLPVCFTSKRNNQGDIYVQQIKGDDEKARLLCKNIQAILTKVKELIHTAFILDALLQKEGLSYWK